MTTAHKTQLERDFLELEKKYNHSPEALAALVKAAEVSCRYIDFIVSALKEGSAEPHKTFKFALNVKAHANRHKNDAAAIKRLRHEMEKLKTPYTP